MTQVTHLNARLIKVERERDALMLVNLKLRDFLLRRAKECRDCEGTGRQTIFGAVLDCPACHDIRKLLA